MIFDSKLRENFYPLTLTKISAGLLFGTKSLLEGIEQNLSAKATDLLVPHYLEDYTKETFNGLEINKPVSTSVVVINALVSSRPEIWKFIIDALTKKSENFAYFDRSGTPVFGKLDECSEVVFDFLRGAKSQTSSISKKARMETLPVGIEEIALIRFPWELVRDNVSKIQYDYCISSSFSSNNSLKISSSDVYIRGNNLAISQTADVERFVTLDSRKGPVIIDDNAEIQSFSHLTGPCYVGKNAKVRSARLRGGTTIGAGTKVAGEVEASIFSEFSNKSHEGFIGHSIVGSWVNLGALTSCSDLKNTYGKISVNLGRKLVQTGEIKVGVYIGDMAKTTIGALLTSGKKIGVASQVFGPVSEDVPSFTMYGRGLRAKSCEVVLHSVLQTQQRMMERRGLVMSESMASMIRSVYKMTRGERAFQRVSKARFKLP